MRYSFRLGISLWNVHLDYKLWDYDTPNRGDIITFDPPREARADGKTFVKRVVAVPGDNLKLQKVTLGKDKYVFDVIDVIVNNQKPPRRKAEDRRVLSDVDDEKAPLNHLYYEETGGKMHYVLYHVENKLFESVSSSECFVNVNPGGCTLPVNKFFAMGDNRDDSSDSRYWGFVDREFIYGKVAIIYFSVNWKDRTCHIKNHGELYKKYSETALDLYSKIEDYPEEERYEYCYREGSPQTGYYYKEPSSIDYNESLGQWFQRMIRRRLWRADVRWSRIGKILE